ncbi:flagellar assembly protein FliW [Paenibacillus senegalensis]|uniref:flagellar assembly protein FliW n=1 Tax=Paenibacillus senegalensis TaxID=1465766 RepID=UPI000289F137|nr:flagellar assembly protein FliW [Paenibacillus senegalensis]
MKISTARFGELEIQEEQMIHFPQGLPGFEELRKFTWVNTGEEMPFSFLQSVEDGSVAFITVDPFLFYPEYSFELSGSIKEDLKIERENDVQIKAIVTIRGSLESATINLQAPIVVNPGLRVAKQVILHDTVYKSRHALIRHQTGLSSREG